MSKHLRVCSVILYIVTTVLCAQGQFEAGSVLGTAADATGAVIPKASVAFNTADFRAPAQYQFGNVGRNILYGPGTMQVDASLFKDFNFTADGARRLQTRVEAFNVFNTPQFNNPNAQIGSTTAGTITSAGAPLLFQRTSRQIQIAAKIYF